MNRLYVFYNFTQSREGAPFAICDKHKKDYKPPENCIMREIAKHASMPCFECDADPEAKS